MKRWWLRLGPYAVLERGRLGVLLALMLVGIVLQVLMPWPLKLLLDHLLSGEALPPGLVWLRTLPGAAQDPGLLAWLALSMLIIYVASNGVLLLRSILQAGVSARMQYSLARDVLAHLQTMSLRFHSRAAKGDLVRRATEDTSCVPQLVTGAFLPLIDAVLILVALFGIMWQLDNTLAVIAIAVAVPMGVLMKLLGPRMTERAYEEHQTQGELWSISESALTALPLVQAFGREEHENFRFRGVASRSIRAHLRSLAAQIQFNVGVQGSVAVGTGAVLVFGGLRVLDGGSTVGTLVVVLSYLAALHAPLVTLAYLSPKLARAAASARRVMELLDTPGIPNDVPGARPLATSGSRLRGHVRFEGVNFEYQPGSPILHDIDLDVPPGMTIALVGATGAGKSTLISLLARLFDPCKGRILFDGQDIRQATLTSVRAQVSMLHQDPFLLPLSVADNIAYARPSATRTQIVAAATVAGIHEFILRLGRGYDTIIGERGISLSGGQRQRLAIARAILKDAPILVLDEPTAALDAETEEWVMSAIERLTVGRTTFIIAHRLATIRRAHRIVVMDAGRIVEVGTSEELLERKGFHYRLLNPTPSGHGDTLKCL